MNRLLSASWYCRRHNIEVAEGIVEQFGLTADQVQIVQTHVIDKCLCHDELTKLLKSIF